MEVIGNKLPQASTTEHTDLPAFIPRYLAVSSAYNVCGVWKLVEVYFQTLPFFSEIGSKVIN